MIQTSDYDIIFGSQNSKFISLHMLNSNVTNLGAGKRFGLWVQGCLKHCPDCIASNAQDIFYGTIKACDELADLILSFSDIAGITVSGGEPILQWRAVNNILSKVKKESSNLNVLLFTGYVFEDDLWPYMDSESDLYNAEFAGFFDMLDWWIDGQYEGEKDDGFGLRGSSNQKLYGNITFPNTERKIACRQINEKEWETLTGKFGIPRGTKFFLEDDLMTNFSTKERMPEWDTVKGQIIGIPTKNQVAAFDTLQKNIVGIG